MSRRPGHPARRAAAITLTFCLGMSAASGGADTAAADFLARLSSLAGEWEGTYQWSGGRTDSGKMKAKYSLTGAGSAVVENLYISETPLMTSVYHLDGNDLRMAHYCAARNQPRLRATRLDPQSGTADFSFVDATNLVASPSHVAGFQIRFLEEDRIELIFRFVGSGKESQERIDLKRVRA